MRIALHLALVDSRRILIFIHKGIYVEIQKLVWLNKLLLVYNIGQPGRNVGLEVDVRDGEELAALRTVFERDLGSDAGDTFQRHPGTSSTAR